MKLDGIKRVAILEIWDDPELTLFEDHIKIEYAGGGVRLDLTKWYGVRDGDTLILKQTGKEPVHV